MAEAPMAEAQASTISNPHHHHRRWFHISIPLNLSQNNAYI